ncbi:MAG TPA: hypothetical protein VN803_07315 [Gemmatimonadales bacterium]|nr:hypothetical protein [Gemmatimonadales bacterium]
MSGKPAVMLVVALGVLGPGFCEANPSGLTDGVVLGTWGGENAALIADDTSAHVHIGCTYGNIPQAIEPDAAGYFDVPGEQNIRAPCGSRRDASGAIQRASVSRNHDPDDHAQRYGRDARPREGLIRNGAEDGPLPHLPSWDGSAQAVRCPDPSCSPAR